MNKYLYPTLFVLIIAQGVSLLAVGNNKKYQWKKKDLRNKKPIDWLLDTGNQGERWELTQIGTALSVDCFAQGIAQYKSTNAYWKGIFSVNKLNEIATLQGLNIIKCIIPIINPNLKWIFESNGYYVTRSHSTGYIMEKYFRDTMPDRENKDHTRNPRQVTDVKNDDQQFDPFKFQGLIELHEAVKNLPVGKQKK